jgi:hypothetical protein
MNTATTFTLYGECFRCHGFRRAFATFSHTNGGRCLRCNGALREPITKPLWRLEEFEGSAAKRRADSVAIIAKVLARVGEPAMRDAQGKKASEWGFAYRVKSDTLCIFVSALTIAPADVRVRGWAAFCAKARATLGERAESVIASARKKAVEYGGMGTDGVGAWLGETAEAARAA